jgi:hypothetical protein
MASSAQGEAVYLKARVTAKEQGPSARLAFQVAASGVAARSLAWLRTVVFQNALAVSKRE